ncbi:MAG: DUF4346 domain-containing protein [Candidatus Thermoplasmatota archaeon]
MVDKDVALIEASKTSKENVSLDPNGFFVIEVDRKKSRIRAEFYSNVYKKNRIVSGDLQKVFLGEKADALCDTIARNVEDLLPEHYLYLGRELQKAEYALQNDVEYVQDGC